MQKAVIIINPTCHQGKGWKRWLLIRDEVQKRLPSNCTTHVLEKGVKLNEVLEPYLQQPEPTLVVSAGGDGSVHYLVNYLLKERKETFRHLSIGAIGLGSSNDFLKPFGEKINGVPIRINQGSGTFLHDVGIVTYLDDANIEQQKFFVVNASVGITAEANWKFNHPGVFLQFLKKQATGTAIIYTAVSSIFNHRNKLLLLKYNETILHAPISNINVLKVPFVSGNLFYNQAIKRDDGQLSLNVCIDMSKPELLSILKKLQKGNFPQNNKTLVEATTDIHISADQPFVFECDGETEKTRSLHVSILPNTLAVLKC